MMVDRFVICYDARGEQRHPNGDFVHYADYSTLSARVAQLEEALGRIAAMEGTAGTESGSEYTITDQRGMRKGNLREGLFASDIARAALSKKEERA